MTINLIRKEEFDNILAAALAARDKHRVSEDGLAKGVNKVTLLTHEEEDPRSGYQISIYNEEEITSLLRPFLRGMMDVPVVALAAPYRGVGVSALLGLSKLRSNTAFSLLIPQNKEGDRIDISLFPVATRLKQTYAVDGLAEYLFG